MIRTAQLSHRIAAIFVTLCIAWPAASHAGPIVFDTFQQFAFAGAGFATGCDPADPAGGFCTPSSGTATSFLTAPPWTFTANGAGAVLTVTDAFTAGDRFTVYDSGVPIGTTSAPVGTADCSDDPVPCLADPNISKGSFNLGAGNHSITIAVLTAGSGSGYLSVSAIPEPSTILILSLGGFATLCALGRRKPVVSTTLLAR